MALRQLSTFPREIPIKYYFTLKVGDGVEKWVWHKLWKAVIKEVLLLWVVQKSCQLVSILMRV